MFQVIDLSWRKKIKKKGIVPAAAPAPALQRRHCLGLVGA